MLYFVHLSFVNFWPALFIPTIILAPYFKKYSFFLPYFKWDIFTLYFTRGGAYFHVKTIKVFSSSIMEGLEEDLTCNVTKVDLRLSVLKPLHASWKRRTNFLNLWKAKRWYWMDGEQQLYVIPSANAQEEW